MLTFEKLLKARTIGKFEIMSNLNLFVAGSIQGSEQFSDIARGPQYSFMSFSALLFAHTLPMDQWTASNVISMLLKVDPSLTETLSLDYQPREMRWPLDANTIQIYTRQTNDAFDEHENHSLNYTSLRSALMNAFSSNNLYAFIILEGYIL